jgi:hypothetical protein
MEVRVEIEQAGRDLVRDVAAVRQSFAELARRVLLGVGVALGVYIAHRVIWGLVSLIRRREHRA